MCNVIILLTNLSVPVADECIVAAAPSELRFRSQSMKIEFALLELQMAAKCKRGIAELL